MTEKKNNKVIYHIAFVLICGALFLFLWNAPPETTARLPHDANHEQFMDMKKKEAEAFCTECHSAEQIPLPVDHPRPNRCLFCHKRDPLP